MLSLKNVRTLVPLLCVLVGGGLVAGCGTAAQPAASSGTTEAASSLQVAEAVEVGRAWTGLPVDFALLTERERQYVAYYDAERRLTVAARRLGRSDWTRVRLDEIVAWDSHNHIAMALDRDGRLHLAANMHNDALNYYRTADPHDVTTFRQVNRMTGQDEGRVTYPHFLQGPDERLVFYYRDGGSGRGRRIFNAYDEGAGRWRRLLDEPLLDGRPADMNAYPLRPRRGPDGAYHLVWMWRDTPDAATNHDISYMRSPDLVHWETAAGEPLTLPVTPSEGQVTVDPVAAGDGLINMGFALGFDGEACPIVSYHKYDAKGNSQLYNARWQDSRWKIVQASNWATRWDFGGHGSIPSRVGAGPVRTRGDGTLVQSFHHWQAGEGRWQLDAESLQVQGPAQEVRSRPSVLQVPRSDASGMQVHWQPDAGAAPTADTHYVLRWETLGPNRDHQREATAVPPAEPLMVYALTEQ